MSNCFEIVAKDSRSKARFGVLRTKTGEYETPFFMPVATKGAVKYIDINELEEMGTSAFISNAFLLYLKPGLGVIKKHGDLHSLTNWKKCIFSDSGGFQVLSLEGFKGDFSDKGLKFKSPFDGSLHELTPEKVMQIEQELGSDVAMCLDQMPTYGLLKKEVSLATERTHKFAERCLKAHKDKKQLLFGICQGGTFSDLRTSSAQFISSLNFDGIALGGLCIGEPLEKTHEMIKASVENLPSEKPKYLMGVGSPSEIFEAVSQGIDIFDSVWPTRNARHGSVMTRTGDIDIGNSKFKKDLSALDLKCSCKVCKEYSRAYLYHLYRMNEPLGMKLLSYHNLFFLQELMKNIREGIKKGKFEDVRNEYQ